MQKGLKMDGQLRAMAIALGGAAVMSVVAMFIPASIFETITGATGISELVPATGAPLGDTARALIAFGFGAATFAFLAAYLMRRPAQVRTSSSERPATKPVNTDETATANAVTGSASFFDRVRAKISAFNDSRRNGVAVTELSDLPKLRAGDAHPDAPPRRPISAHRDFGEIPTDAALPVAADDVADDDVVVAAPIAAPAPIAPLVEPDAAVKQTALPEADAPVSAPVVAETPIDAPLDIATLSSMVDRLEMAVAQRQDQLAKLEALASAKPATPVSYIDDADAEADMPTVAESAEIEIIPASSRPLSFAATPMESQDKGNEADEMDAALRSALETLHRMNARTR
jgi:hypothetical protein